MEQLLELFAQIQELAGMGADMIAGEAEAAEAGAAEAEGAEVAPEDEAYPAE